MAKHNKFEGGENKDNAKERSIETQGGFIVSPEDIEKMQTTPDGRQVITILRGINLDLHPGDFVDLEMAPGGPGSGKSVGKILKVGETENIPGGDFRKLVIEIQPD